MRSTNANTRCASRTDTTATPPPSQSRSSRAPISALPSRKHSSSCALFRSGSSHRAARLPRSSGLEQLGRLSAFRAGVCPATCGHHPVAVGRQLATKVGAIQTHLPDGLEYCAQLRERERGADECRRQTSRLEVVADAVERVA